MGVAEADGRIPTQSLAGALVDSYYIIDTVLETTAEQGAKLTNFDRIKSAFELGHTGRKEGLCDQVFACENKNIDIALPSVARSQQVDCSDLAQVCPGVSQSVSLPPPRLSHVNISRPALHLLLAVRTVPARDLCRHLSHGGSVLWWLRLSL